MLRERLHIFEDVRQTGLEIIFGHFVSRWAVPHVAWTQIFLVKGGGSLSGDGTRKRTSP